MCRGVGRGEPSSWDVLETANGKHKPSCARGQLMGLWFWLPPHPFILWGLHIGVRGCHLFDTMRFRVGHAISKLVAS